MDINKQLAYIELSITEDGILNGILRSNFYNEFTSKQAGINGIARAIHVDGAERGGHAPRMKVYKNESHKRNDPCISLSMDNNKVTVTGDIKNINMGTKELNLYKDICNRNWELMCYCYNNGLSAEQLMLNDEKRRNDKKNPKQIKRDKTDGGYRYSEIRYDGEHGAKIKHNMVEFPGKEPIEEE